MNDSKFLAGLRRATASMKPGSVDPLKKDLTVADQIGQLGSLSAYTFENETGLLALYPNGRYNPHYTRWLESNLDRCLREDFENAKGRWSAAREAARAAKSPHMAGAPAADVMKNGRIVHHTFKGGQR